MGRPSAPSLSLTGHPHDIIYLKRVSLGNQSSYKGEIIHYLMGVQEIHIKKGSNFKNKQTQINFFSNSYYISTLS